MVKGDARGEGTTRRYTVIKGGGLREQSRVDGEVVHKCAREASEKDVDNEMQFRCSRVQDALDGFDPSGVGTPVGRSRHKKHNRLRIGIGTKERTMMFDRRAEKLQGRAGRCRKVGAVVVQVERFRGNG